MVTYYVKENDIYTIVSTTVCVVYDATGEEIATCPANTTVNIKASTNKFTLSDNDAAIKKAITDSGEANTDGFSEHLLDASVHTTVSEKANFTNHIADSSVHITFNEKENFINHINSGSVHLTSADKTKISNSAQIGSNVSFQKVDVTDVVCSSVVTTTVSTNTITKQKQSSGITDNSVLNKGECDSLYSGLIGEVRWFAGSSVPSGWLKCDGTAVSRTTYAKLFAAVGTAWGAGDGSKTFNLPNLIDKVAWGASAAGGYIEAGLPNITGNFYIRDYNGNRLSAVISSSTKNAFESGTYTGNYGKTTSNPDTLSSSDLTFDASRSNAIYGKSSTVQPPAAKLIPIIKY